MIHPDKRKNPIERVTEIYVGIFTVHVFDETLKAETILAGFQKDPDKPGMARARATIETHFSAVPDLVAMCDEIVNEQKEIESFRLLKFDKAGVHELNPSDFRNLERFSFRAYPETHWGIC